MDKQCCTCKEFKNVIEFGKRKGRPNGTSQCKQCERDRKAGYMRERRASNIEAARKYDREYRKANPKKIRSINLKRLYGLTLEDFNRILLQQDNKCAICPHEHLDGHKSTILHVDHDHITGANRGLLCKKCNTGLGEFKDNIQWLLNAVEYLKKYVAKDHKA